MKLVTLLLLVALVGKIAANPIHRPRQVYQVHKEKPEVEESAEDAQSDETDVDVVEDEEPQGDDISDEDDDPPPKFNTLFPAPGRTGRPGATAQNQAFANMMREIDENGWKRPKEINQPPPKRLRSNFIGRPVFRADDDDEESDEEDDNEEDDLDDDISVPDFDVVFPNVEGNPSGPPVSVTDESGQLRSGLRFRAVPYGRPQYVYRGRSQQGPVYFSRQIPSQANVRVVQANQHHYNSLPPRRVAAPPVRVSYAQNPYYYYGGGSRRPVSMSYRQRQVPYPQGNNRRVVQVPSGYRQQMGPVYVNNHGRYQQQYYSRPPVRRTYSPMIYAQRPRNVQQQSRPYYVPSQSSYGLRSRRNYNGRYWHSQ